MAAYDKILLAVFATLLVLLVAQHFFFLRQIQKLVDKLMSRDFHDYQRSIEKPEIKPRVQLPIDPPEDLGSLHGFQIP